MGTVFILACALAGVPVGVGASWLTRRWRTRASHARSVIEATMTGVLFGLSAWIDGPQWHLPALLYLATISVPLAMIDIEKLRLPNAIVLPSIVVASVGLSAAVLAEGAAATVIVRLLVGGLLTYVGYWALRAISRRGIGGGDVRLGAVLGLYTGFCGWPSIALTPLLTFVLGGIIGAFLLVSRRVTTRTRIPMGPFMLTGTWLAMLVGK